MSCQLPSSLKRPRETQTYISGQYLCAHTETKKGPESRDERESSQGSHEAVNGSSFPQSVWENLKMYEPLGKAPRMALQSLWGKVSPRIKSVLIKSDKV